MPDSQLHYAVIDARPSVTPAFRSQAEVDAALTAWLKDGIEIVKRCRIDKERVYFRGSLVELAVAALASWDEYQGYPAKPTEMLYAQVEKIVGEAEGR